LLALGQLLGQFGFARSHSLRDPILRPEKCSKYFQIIFRGLRLRLTRRAHTMGAT
jgi:hypothetical protein